MNVLIVDDELLVRTGVQSLIQWEEHPFTLAGAVRSAEEALKIIPNITPVIIVTDISMPGMNGIELMERVRSLDHAAEFIVLTCQRDFETAKSALELGAVDYLVKYDLKTDAFLRALHKAYDKLVHEGHAENNQDASQAQGNQTSVSRYLLLVRIDNAGAVLKERDRGVLTSSQTALISQLSGPETDILLISSSGSLWVYAVHAIRMGQQRTAEAWMKVGERIRAKLASVLNISSRVCITHAADTASASARFDRMFCREGSVLVDLKSEDAELSDVSDAMRSSEKLHTHIAGLHRCVENQSWSEFEQMIQSCFQVCRTLCPQRDRVISEMLSLARRIQGIDLDCHRRNWWVTIEARITDAASLDSLYAVWQDIIGEVKAHMRQSVRLPDDISRVLRYIDEHYHQDISLHDAASLANKSDSYFSSYFMKHMHMHFIDYINQKRIDAASRMLLAPVSLSLKEIAYSCGFSSEKYFIRVFKHVRSCTPKQWKSKNSAL